ncbi:hypothetical protein ACVME8_000343 [Bradyrhizobium diazoefficiens]
MVNGQLSPLFRGDLDSCKSQRACDTGAIGWIGLYAIGNVSLLDIEARVTHRARRVVEQQLTQRRCHFAEEVAGPRGPAVMMLRLSATGAPVACDMGGRESVMLCLLFSRRDGTAAGLDAKT